VSNKYYKKKTWVSEHERYDPRLNRMVHVSRYDRNQRYKRYSEDHNKRGKVLTNREFLLGDFDGDRIRNVDDKYPFKKSKETVEEMQLSDALIKLNKVHHISDENRKDILKRFREVIKETKPTIREKELEKLTPSRAKTPISLLHKSLKYQIPETTDKIGMMYVGNNYNDLNNVKKGLKKKFEVIDDRDYYQNPKLGYKAIHLILKDTITGDVFEVQLKSKRIKRISEINHTLYKKGTQNTEEFRRIINLCERADNGNKEAQHYIDNLSNKEIAQIISNKEL